MFTYNLKIAYRNLVKHKGYSFINILGLSIGMAASFLILQYVQFELSYDDFHQNSENIYRVELEYIRNGVQIFDSAENFAGAGSALKEELNEVIDFTRLYNAGRKYNCIVTYNPPGGAPVSFKEKKLYYADANFLTMFSFPLSKGSVESALSEPNTAVISEFTAKKYFGEEDPVGKTLEMRDNVQNKETCIITGVFKNLPQNSHLQIDLLFSFKTLHGRNGGIERYENSWYGRDNFYTYILFQPGSNPRALEAKFPAIIDKYKPRLKEVDKNNKRIRVNLFTLQPLADIHLYSNLKDDAEINGNANTVYFLIIIAILILSIAWVNFINLSTAKSMERAHEIGVRKVVGASRVQLIKQFLMESFLVNLIAGLIAIFLMEILLPLFQNIVGITMPNVLFGSWQNNVIIFIVFQLGILVSGLYPSFILSAFKPISALKGKNIHGNNSHLFLRRGLTVFQFTAAVVFIAGAMAINRQVEFMLNQDLGFNPEQILVTKKPVLDSNNLSIRRSQFITFKNELLKYPTIKNVTSTSTVPGNATETGLAVTRMKTENLDEVHSIPQVFVDEDFISTYQMKLIAGRNFSSDMMSDDSSVVLNESAVKLLGFTDLENTIGQDVFLFTEQRNKIIGIIKDHHQESLRNRFSANIFRRQPKNHDYYIEYLSIKISTHELNSTISTIGEKWAEIFPNNPFEYFFLNDHFNEQYKADQRLGRIFNLFTIFAIIVACLGLLGLSSLLTIQRTKEIGIRKVLGASIANILYLLSKDFASLVGLAFLIACPFIYFGIESWLQNFAFRFDLNWHLFVFPGASLFVIAFMTISVHTVRAAISNPVEALRNE